MAILIPSMGACVARMTSGERRVAERLEAKLHADYLVLHGDGIPLLKPVSCGREGQVPLIIQLPTLLAEAEAIADHLAQADQEGFAWGDVAVLCPDTQTRDLCARTRTQRKLPVKKRLGSDDFDPTSNKIKVMTMKVSKGLEFPVVALPGVGHMPARGRTSRRLRGCFMWRLLGLLRGW